jgi:5'-3' exonuclease
MTKKKNRLIIIDADSIIFTVAWRFRSKKTKNLVKINTNKFISDVLSNSGADDFIGFFAKKDKDDIKLNFRYKVDPNYKSNRPKTPDFVIKWRPTIHTEFQDTWGFYPVEGMEADDAVAITAEYYRDQYKEIVIATFDKDLKQIPNSIFYNMKDHTQTKISEFDAAYNFYTQMIMGDSGDAIRGIPGVGKAGAKKVLKDKKTVCQMFIATVKEYSKTEDKLRKKLFKEKLAEVRKRVNEDVSNGVVSKLSKLSPAKFNRKVRLMIKQDVEDAVNELFPGGWKAYYKKQHALLHMLTEPIDDFEVPEIQENKSKLKTESTAKSEEELDEFLTL